MLQQIEAKDDEQDGAVFCSKLRQRVIKAFFRTILTLSKASNKKDF